MEYKSIIGLSYKKSNIQIDEFINSIPTFVFTKEQCEKASNAIEKMYDDLQSVKHCKRKITNAILYMYEAIKVSVTIEQLKDIEPITIDELDKLFTAETKKELN